MYLIDDGLPPLGSPPTRAVTLMMRARRSAFKGWRLARPRRSSSSTRETIVVLSTWASSAKLFPDPEDQRRAIGVYSFVGAAGSALGLLLTTQRRHADLPSENSVDLPRAA
jgi:hypothetical protein